MSYTPPPTITNTPTTSAVLRGLEHVDQFRMRELSGLHPATLGAVIENLIDLVVMASGGDQSRVDDALRFVPACLERANVMVKA